MSVLNLVLAFTIAIAPVVCDQFTIVPSATSNCPGELTGEVCLTLQQYVSNPSQSSEVILLFQPGLHRLAADFVASSSIGNFSMTSAGAIVSCDTHSRSLTWTQVENINITGVSFTGCGDILIEKAIRVKFIGVSILNSGHTSITQSSAPYYQDPESNTVLRNVTFQNCSGTLIWLMQTVVFEHVTYNNSRRITVQSTAKTIHGSQSIAYTNATFNITQSLFINSDLQLYFSRVLVSNSTFRDSPSVGMYAQDVTLTVENSVFLRNRGMGGLHSSNSNLTVTNCTFTSNSAYGNGAAMLLEYMNYLKVRDSMFFNNQATTGGAIYFTGGILMATNSVFNLNTATKKGGAIYALAYFRENSLVTSKSRFVNNSAADGGAVYVDYSVPNPYITNNVLHSTDDIFERNTASGSGGAIYSNITTRVAILSVRNSVFRNNVAVGERGGAVLSTGVNIDLSFVGSTFDSNSAPSCGVVDASNHVTVEFESSSFMNNVATGHLVGGGVACVKNASVSIRNSTFTYNAANLHAGVLYIDNSFVNVCDSTFLGNSAAVKGGVMYTQIVSTEYTISHSAFSYNSAGESGGMMYLNSEGSQANVTGSIISFNRAINRGGAFSLIRGLLNLTESNIYDNTADKGGAISACDSTVQVQGLTSTVDTTQPICILYDGFVNSSNIVPPHNYDSLLTTTPTSPPTSIPHPSAAISSATSVSNRPYHPPSHTPYYPPSPTSTFPSSTVQRTYPTECPRQVQTDTHCTTENEEIKRLTILVCTFAVIIIVLMLCLIAMAAKILFDCVRARMHKVGSSQSISLGAVNAGAVSYQPLAQSVAFKTGTETPSIDSMDD